MLTLNGSGITAIQNYTLGAPRGSQILTLGHPAAVCQSREDLLARVGAPPRGT